MRNLSEDTILLYGWEYDLIVSRKKKLHFHVWDYRRATLPGHLGIVTDAPTIHYTEMPSGRYCLKCGHVQFLPAEVVAKQGAMFWTQSDLNYLLGSLMRPDAVSGDSEPVKND